MAGWTEHEAKSQNSQALTLALTPTHYVVWI